MDNIEWGFAYAWLFVCGIIAFSFIAFGLVKGYKSYKAYKYRKRLSKFKVIDGGKYFWRK